MPFSSHMTPDKLRLKEGKGLPSMQSLEADWVQELITIIFENI